jgi:hypothetical protein
MKPFSEGAAEEACDGEILEIDPSDLIRGTQIVIPL